MMAFGWLEDLDDFCLVGEFLFQHSKMHESNLGMEITTNPVFLPNVQSNLPGPSYPSGCHVPRLLLC